MSLILRIVSIVVNIWLGWGNENFGGGAERGAQDFMRPPQEGRKTPGIVAHQDSLRTVKFGGGLKESEYVYTVSGWEEDG